MRPILLCLIVSTLTHAAEPLELKLWPEGAPGKMLPHSKFTEDFIRTKAGKSTITDISDPTITVFRPEKPNGTSVIVAPGGAYIFLSAIHEGTQVCEWLRSIGVTGILLKYRTPTRDEAAPHEKPVADAAKAIALVRERAKEWQLDPNRVGLLGFSAGGNLLAHIACDRPAAPALPNFGVMIYGGGFLDSKEPTKLKEGFTVPADAPPIFIACAHDDGQNPIASTLLYLEYKKHSHPRRAPPLHQRRSRLRHERQQTAHQRLAPTLRRVDGSDGLADQAVKLSRQKRNSLREKRNGLREKRNGLREKRNGLREKRNGLREKRNGLNEKRNGLR
jgi:acetyl esterase/lipase